MANEKANVCNLTNAMGIVVAQFPATDNFLREHTFVAFGGKIFQRNHAAGGGHPTFYEVKPHMLSAHDILPGRNTREA